MRTLNLITDAWLPALTRSGTIRLIRPAEIVDPDIVDVSAPSAELSIAGVEFLIGLLSTAAAPEDENEWLSWWNTPPSPNDLQHRFSRYAYAFNLTGAGPLFCQDRTGEGDATEMPVAFLMIDAPGENTFKENRARPGDALAELPLNLAALAIYLMQSQAPYIGVGKDANLRGGGCLSTHVVAREALWQRVWLNVETQEQIAARAPVLVAGDENIFGWLDPLRRMGEGAPTTTTSDAHPLHAYWQMPRRFRLIADADGMVRRIVRASHGINYASDWQHPLTPMVDVGTPKQRARKTDPVMSCSDWVGVLYREPKGTKVPAQAVTHALRQRVFTADIRHARVAMGGFLTNKAKVLGYAYSEQPVIIAPSARGVEIVEDTACRLIEAADVVRDSLERALINSRQVVHAKPRRRSPDLSLLVEPLWAAIEAELVRLTVEAAQAGAADLEVQGRIFLEAAGRAARRVYDRVVDQDPLREDFERAVRARHGLTLALQGYGDRGQALYKALMISPPGRVAA